MNQPMEMIKRKLLTQFFERGRNYKYHWLPDGILYPKIDCISRYRAPHTAGFRSHYLELPTM